MNHFVFTENTSVISATAVHTAVNDVKSITTDVATSQNYKHKSSMSCYQYSGQNCKPMNSTLTCDIRAQQQRQRDASDNFSKIFQTSGLELTDADLEFDPK